MEKINKKFYLLIFVFLISMFSVNAVVNGTRTTFDTFSNGSASTTLGDYSVAFGSLEEIGTQMNSFNNDSAVYKKNVTVAAKVARSLGHINISNKLKLNKNALTKIIIIRKVRGFRSIRSRH